MNHTGTALMIAGLLFFLGGTLLIRLTRDQREIPISRWTYAIWVPLRALGLVLATIGLVVFVLGQT